MSRAARPEIYVSTDVESDGPIPGPHSMLSIGSAAFDADGAMLGTFTRNLETLEGASGHPDTMAFWAREPEAWAAHRADLVAPDVAMRDYVAWVRALPGRPCFVAYPAGYDFTFVYWYLMRFVGESPFSHSALDVKTLAWSLMGGDYRDATKRNMPKAWMPKARHTHVALDDAIEQGELFCNVLRALRTR